MKIEVIRAFSIAGERQEVGSVIDVDVRFGRELIHNGKAVEAVEKPAAPKAAAKAPKESKE